MNTKLTIKNFRVFDEDGVTVDLKPITVLTGCNSSGKSSVVKAALMLNDVLKQLKDELMENEKFTLKIIPHNISTVKLDFTKFPYNLLGRFDRVLNNSESDKITFEYTAVNNTATVSLEFVTEKYTKLSNAYLDKITISCEDGILFWTEKDTHQESLWNKEKEERQRNQKEENAINVGNILPLTIYKCKKNLLMWNNLINKKDFLLTDIPILDDLNIIKKSAFEAYFEYNQFVDYMKKSINKDLNNSEPILLKDIAKSVNKYTKEVVDGFLNSDYQTFDAYFRKLQEDYFSNCGFESYNEVIIPEVSMSSIWEEKPIFWKTLLILLYWNEKLHPEKKHQPYKKVIKKWGEPELEAMENENTISINFYFPELSDLNKKINENLGIIIKPLQGHKVTYVNSDSAIIKRLYSLDQKDTFTLLLKQYMNSEKKGLFIDKWIKKFGIGDRIRFEYDNDGVGVKIRLFKTPEDTQGRLLADEGYGITQLLSIMLQMELYYTDLTNHFKPSDLTISSCIAVEEPEIHLHPKYQSLLADMFVDAYQNRGIHFIIETHSEYLIRRFQLLVAGIETEKKLDKNDVSIAYIYTKEEAEKENQPRVKNIAICEDGYLDDTFGSGFFDEATKLSRKLM